MSTSTDHSTEPVKAAAGTDQAAEHDPHDAPGAEPSTARRWYDYVLGTKTPSRRWNELVDDVVDGVDYGESPLPIERRDHWFGFFFGPGMHYFRKICQMPAVRVLHWPLLMMANLCWWTLRGLALLLTVLATRTVSVYHATRQQERAARVREISMSQPERIERAIKNRSIFGVEPGRTLLQRVGDSAGMREPADLKSPEIYGEFIDAALATPKFVRLLDRALGQQGVTRP
jgi:hypothetical protein